MRRNRREHAARLSDQIADLRQRDSREAVNRRSDFGEAEIQLRVFNGGFVRFDLCLRRQVRLNCVVQFLLADGLFLRERRVALHVQFRFARLRLVLRKFGLGLIQRGLKRARINLKQQIAFFHLAAFGVVLREQITGYLRVDLRVHKSVERADPFLKNGNVRRRKRDDPNFRRRWRRGLFLAAVGKQKCRQNKKTTATLKKSCRWQKSCIHNLFLECGFRAFGDRENAISLAALMSTSPRARYDPAE